MENKQKIKQSWKPFRHLIKTSKLPWGLYILNFVLSLVYTSVYAMMPQVKSSILAGEIFSPALVATYVIVTLASALLNFPLGILSKYVDYTSQRRLRRNVWKKMIHLPMSSLDTMEPTSLVSRVTTDTSQITTAVSYVFAILQYTYALVMIFAIIAAINVKITVMLIVFLIPFVLLAVLPSHFMHNAQYAISNALSQYTNFLSERLGSIEQIKVFSAEEKEDIANDAASKARFKAQRKQLLLSLISQPLGFSMEAVVQGVVLIYGGALLSQGLLTAEQALTIFMYADTMYLCFYQFVLCWQYFKIAQGAAKTASEISLMEPEEMEREISFAIPDADLALENVTFAYGGGQKVLDNVSMTFPCGKVTAIVGPSGSGKTTVLKLLERLYQPDEGEVRFGDISAEKIHLNEWRNSFGMVPQNNPLLFGTVRDNITYGVPENVPDETLKRAMSAANVDELVEKMPDGLDTDIGDVGSRLSGGERQRIALARMMIRDPEYLLLDEATSSLDARNESQIVNALGQLMQGRTTIVVAHNIRTVENADKIIFLDGGKVTGEGTHSELYETNATYRRYFDQQQVV